MGNLPPPVVGETRVMFTRDGRRFEFEGLIVENLDIYILGGTLFMEKNDLTIRPAKRQIILSDGTVYLSGSNSTVSSHSTIRRAWVLRAPAERTTIWPGEYMSKCPFPLTSRHSTDHSHWNHLSMLLTCNKRSHHGFSHPLVSSRVSLGSSVSQT